MLYLDAPMVIRGVEVFRDYNDRSRFHYLPGTPRIASESGQPMFQLLVYRDAGTPGAAVQGGGFLSLTTDLGLPRRGSTSCAASSRRASACRRCSRPCRSRAAACA